MGSKTPLEIFDTTLRDGGQAEKINFSVEDKVLIATKLDEFGVDYIEGGWPMSAKDVEFFDRMKSVKLKHAKLAAFGSTHHPKNKAPDDPNLKSLVAAETPVTVIFGKTWDLHVTEALRIPLERNLEMITDSVKFLKARTEKVVYDAEHFFDGYKANPGYALKTVSAAVEAGADTVCLCDTNGGNLPFDIERMVREVREKFPPVSFGIHCHNDSGCAVANTLAAVRTGCLHIQGTVNGFGERCGNVSLCSVLPALKLKMGLDFFAAKNLERLTELSRFVFEIANLEHDHRAPYVGESAFAHKGGIHVSAVQKLAATYEHVTPESVGNQRRVLISDQAGKSNILFKIRELGLKVDAESDTAKTVVKRIKELENEGFEFENADASFELLINKLTGQYKPVFDLSHFRLITEKTENRALVSEGVVKITIKNKEEYVVATGNGPVNALDNALRKALEKEYPQIREMTLVDYKVRVLGQKQGTESHVRVLIESRKADRTWVTVGASENIIEASWQALVDSVEYMILKKI